MNKIKDAATQFHFNELSEEETSQWFKEIVLNKIKVQIWIKGEEEIPQEYFSDKYEPSNQILWLKFKSSAFKPGKSDYADSDILLKAEIEKVYLFGQTKLFWDEKEKLHFIKLEGKFYRSQQRVSLRVEATPELGMTIKVQIKDKEYEGFDLSFGGTSFFTEEDLEVGQILEKVKVIAEKESFLIPKSKVVKLFEGNEEGQKRVAIVFVKPPHDTEVSITKKVESMKKEIEKKKAKK